MKSIRANTLVQEIKVAMYLTSKVYQLRQSIERPNLVSRGIYNFSQEMGATTEAECNQLHKAKGTSASALIGCGGKKRTRLVPLLSATATHTDMDSDMTVSKYE